MHQESSAAGKDQENGRPSEIKPAHPIAQVHQWAVVCTQGEIGNQCRAPPVPVDHAGHDSSPGINRGSPPHLIGLDQRNPVLDRREDPMGVMCCGHNG